MESSNLSKRMYVHTISIVAIVSSVVAKLWCYRRHNSKRDENGNLSCDDFVLGEFECAIKEKKMD